MQNTANNTLTAETLNAALESGKTVIVATYTRATQYSRKHAGMFFTSAKGDLRVKHGKSSVQLSMGEMLLVGIRIA